MLLDSTLPGSMKPLMQFLRKPVFVAVSALTRTAHEQVSYSSTYQTDALGRDQGGNLSSSRGHTQALPFVLVCTTVLGGLSPESFPDTLCYTLKVYAGQGPSATGSGVDRMPA